MENSGGGEGESAERSKLMPRLVRKFNKVEKERRRLKWERIRV